MKIKLMIILVNSYICLINSFLMNIKQIKSKKDYNKIINSNNKKRLILYNSVPCRACIEVKDKLENLSKKIDDWDFYEVDIRTIFNICKNKNINRVPVLEFYNCYNNPYFIRCIPFVENDILQNFN